MKGLNKVKMLDIRGCINLWNIPTINNDMTELEEFNAHYPFHCCKISSNSRSTSLFELDEGEINYDLKDSMTHLHKSISDFDKDSHEIISVDGSNEHLINIEYSEDHFDQHSLEEKEIHISSLNNNKTSTTATNKLYEKHIMNLNKNRKIKCSPMPDHLNPCEDLLGNDLIRTLLWIIALIVIVTNIIQILFVFNLNNTHLIKTRYSLLILHLSIANILKSVYFLSILTADLLSRNNYHNYVVVWQYKYGCKVSGFIASHAMELSVFILILITIDRYLTIIHSTKPDKQLSYEQIKKLLFIGWIYSFIISIIPLTGVYGGYSNNSVCLALGTGGSSNITDIILASWMPLSRILALFIVMYCYLRIIFTVYKQRQSFLEIHDYSGSSNATFLDKNMTVSITSSRNGANKLGITNYQVNRKLTTLVERKACYIMTSNLICWIPIAVVSLYAIFNSNHKVVYNQMTIKILLVITYPLNALACPFFYTFFASVFKGQIPEFFKNINNLKKSINIYTKILTKNESYSITTKQGHHNQINLNGLTSL